MYEVFLSPPHMGGEERAYIDQAFNANYIAPNGPQLDQFEEAVSSYLGKGLHCVALASGTSALHLALIAADISCGDEVWVSSMTFAGGVFPIKYIGALPRFFDVSPDSWTIDCDILEEQLINAKRNKRLPKAIIPTDLYGSSVDLDRIERLADIFDVKVIVDSAESLGAEYFNGRKAGTGGHASILSFNGNKIITTSGGGMLVTRRKDWADRVRMLAAQSRDKAPHYEHSTVGFNYRLSNVCAAIGLGQMKVLQQRVQQRRQVNRVYQEALSRPGIKFMPEIIGQMSSRWLTTLTLDPETLGVSREDVRRALIDHGIESRPMWKPMHLQPVFEGCRYFGRGIDETLFANGLCLPSGSAMSSITQQRVIEVIQSVLGGE